MDLNLKRRRQEITIADAVVEELLREVECSDKATPHDVLAHYFATVCDRFAYIVDDSSTKRILYYARKGMARKNHELARLQRQVGIAFPDAV